jgi:hypothetical protein
MAGGKNHNQARCEMDSLAIDFTIPSETERIINEIVVFQGGAWSRNRQAAEPHQSFHALWDTGSTTCCISNAAAIGMGLKQTGEGNLVGSQGETTNPIYMLDILLSDGTLLGNVPAAGITTSSSFDFIIGMNIIKLGYFTLAPENTGTHFTFTLP